MAQNMVDVLVFVDVFHSKYRHFTRDNRQELIAVLDLRENGFVVERESYSHLYEEVILFSSRLIRQHVHCPCLQQTPF
jgi:hypothetical protein